MGALPQPLEVIFEVQRKGKGVMKKKKKTYPLVASKE